MKKTEETKTRTHDWLLINVLKDRNDDSIPEGFIVSEEERQAVKQDTPEGKLALLARFAKHKYPAADREIGLSKILLVVSAGIIILVLCLLFRSVTLSGVEKLESGDTSVKLGLFLGAITLQYIVLAVCLILWTFYLLREGFAFVFGRVDKNQQSVPLSWKSWIANPIGTSVIFLHWLGVTVATFVLRRQHSLTFIDFAEQYQHKPRVLQLLANSFAQIFWLFLALFTIGLFVWSSGGTNNRFYWPDSVVPIEQRIYWVQTIQFFTCKGLFTEEEIREVVSRDAPPAASDQDERESLNAEKFKWTLFMFYALTLPLVVRFILLLVIGYLLRIISRTDFKPDTKEKFYRDLIEKITDGIKSTEEGGKSGKEYTDSGGKPVLPDGEKPPAPGPAKTLIFMYDLDIPRKIWQDIFPGNVHVDIFDMERCQSGDWESIRKDIRENKVNVERIVIAFDISIVPADDKLFFVSETAETQTEMDKTYILLSRSETLRRHKGNDSTAIHQAVSQWYDLLTQKTGISAEHIIDNFDHEIDEPGARKRLAAKFRGHQEVFRPAGKYEQSTAIILNGVQEIFGEYEKSPQSFASAVWDDRPVVDERLQSYRRKISELYAEEGKKLSASIGQWAADVDLTEIKKDTEGILGTASEKMKQLGDDALKEGIAWKQWADTVLKTLKPRSALGLVGMIPAAAAGIALGTAAAPLAGPLAVLGLAGAAGGFFAPETIKQLKKGMFRQELQNDSDNLASETSETEANFRSEVSMFIASLAAWAGVHELQGLPPEELAERLSCVLEPVETAVADSVGAIEHAFDESQKIIKIM